jgi:hypothetical protein
MTYRVGPEPDCDYPGLGELQQANVLRPGDLVEIMPTKIYTGTLKWMYPVKGEVNPITFRGISDAAGKKPFFDGRGKQMEAPRAFFELYGSATGTPNDGAWVIENLEFAYAKNNDNSMNAAGIRTVNAAYTRIVSCKIWNCAAGIMTSDESGETVIEDCDVGFCGYGDGHSHNLYIMGQRFLLHNSRIHDSIVGQNVKTRNRYVDISYNHIFFSRDGEIGIIQSGDGTPEGSTVTAQPGSNALVCDNEVLTRKDRSGGNKAMVISFGLDMGTCGRNGTLFLHGNRLFLDNKDNEAIKLTGLTTTLDARHNKIVGSLKILYEKDPALSIAGQLNWTEPNALVPQQWTEPAVYNYTMGETYVADAKPAVRKVYAVLQTPQNLHAWKEQGGLGIEWDPVPGAVMYRVWREKRVNGKAIENTIWGGSTEPRYVDTFQHYSSTPTEKKEYAYRVVAVDMNSNQSAQSAAWVTEHGQPGYPDPAGYLDEAGAGQLSIA